MDRASLSSLGPEMCPFPMVKAPPPLGPVIRRLGGGAPADESAVTDQSGGNSKGRRRKRDSVASDDESSKLASTSGGQALFGAQAYDTASSLPFSSQAAREYEQGSATEWLHMQVGGALERVT
ncbi:hypothetical protein BHE74_00029907 [Ensete ventricosum]|nr:hypothetical protein BHE74_00029907 [Ensete ventricosum]RZR98292.1 hypothetical protein BHM03_00027610 [Ensete ventricosum]